jgi:hypothetical protein
MFHFASPSYQGYDAGDLTIAGDHLVWDSRRLWSLWDMINFNLSGVFTALMMMRNHLNIIVGIIASGKGGDPLEDEYKKNVLNNLQYVHKLCGQYLLSSAEDRIVIIWNMWGRQFSYGELAIELKPLLEAFEADLRKEYFYHYPQRKALPLMMIPGEWSGALSSFPSIKSEVDAGIDCYALEHNEACIFHMMRAAEIGMRALARERQVTFPKHPLEWAEWENIIDQIESKAKVVTTGMSRGLERDAARAFYTAAVAQLRAFKETRNAIMHMRGNFDELDAQRTINRCATS